MELRADGGKVVHICVQTCASNHTVVCADHIFIPIYILHVKSIKPFTCNYCFLIMNILINIT